MKPIERARELRKQMTPQETRLWLRLRALRPQGLHFRRQSPLKGYFLDFVCFERRLVVEIDGAQHGEDTQAAHDEKRDAVLREQGFMTLRFWNSDVNADINSVIDTIFARAMERQRYSHPTRLTALATLPIKGREECATEQGSAAGVAP